MLATDSRSTSLAHCTRCGAPLVNDACPGCSLRLLLDDEPTEKDVPATATAAEERYRVLRKVASGGMGVVWAAEDTVLGRTVALKMLRSARFAEDAEMARFSVEAAAAAGLDHPNIVPVYEAGRLDGQPYFTMKLIDGHSLAVELRGRGRFPAREAAEFMVRIARAVHHAHSRGVLHRDLKPGNILLDAHGNPWLTDFGLAKLTADDAGLTLSEAHLGTPHYMAPEMARGRTAEISVASDVWALGVILWELLCGRPPFAGGTTVEILRCIVEEEPTLPAGAKVDPDLLTLARRCLEKAPAARLACASELADELDRWLRGEPIRARAVTRRERLVKWARRKPAVAALYAVLATAGASGLFLWQRAERAVVSLTATNDQLHTALRVSTATKLAGDARLQVSEDPARALLLAVESVEMTRRTPIGPLPEAASALMGVLQEVSGADVSVHGVQTSYNDSFLRVSWPEAMALQLSPDSRWLVSLAQSPWTAALHDAKDPSGRWQPERVWQAFADDSGSGTVTVLWMPDSRHVFTLDFDGAATLFDMATGVPGAAPTGRPCGSVARPGWRVRTSSVFPQPGDGLPAGLIIHAGEQGSGRFSAQTVAVAADGTPTLGQRFEFKHAERPKMGFARSGRFLAVSGDLTAAPTRVFALNADGGRLIWEDPQPVSGRDLLFSPDERWMVRVDYRGDLHLHRIETQGDVATVVPQATHAGGVGMLAAAVFSPDSRWLATTGQSGAVQLLPLVPGVEPVTLQMGATQGMSMAFSADMRYLAVGTSQHTVHVWNMADIRSARLPRVFRGMPVAVAAVAFSPDGKVLAASGSMGRSARRWLIDESGTGALPTAVAVPPGRVLELASSPDGQWIAAAGTDATQSVGSFTFAAADGSRSVTLPCTGDWASGVAFSQDGRWLAGTGEDTAVHVWAVAELVAAATDSAAAPPQPQFVLDMVETRRGYERTLAFHPRGTLYGVCGDGLLFEWHLDEPDPQASRREYAIHTIHYLLPSIRISPDGRWMAVARHGWDAPKEGSPQTGNQVLLYDVSAPGEPRFVAALKASFHGEADVSFSPDSRWLAAGSASKPVIVWDLAAADIGASRRLSPVAKHSPATAFCPDGHWLAFGGLDGIIHLWDWRGTGQTRSISTGSAVTALAWTDVDRLVSATMGDRLSLWDVNLRRLEALARGIAGRDLSAEEKMRFRVQGR